MCGKLHYKQKQYYFSLNGPIKYVFWLCVRVLGGLRRMIGITYEALSFGKGYKPRALSAREVSFCR